MSDPQLPLLSHLLASAINHPGRQRAGTVEIAEEDAEKGGEEAEEVELAGSRKRNAQLALMHQRSARMHSRHKFPMVFSRFRSRVRAQLPSCWQLWLTRSLSSTNGCNAA